jgi:hypothetical protein
VGHRRPPHLRFPGWDAGDLARQFGNGWQVFRTGRAPVPVTHGVLLLCMVLTATVAARPALAFGRTTLAAVVPSLLPSVASTLGTADLPPQRRSAARSLPSCS